MKGKRRIPPILVSALLTAGMLFCNGTSVQAELNFGELGSENNQIAAPAAGITASPEAVALDDLGISIVPGSYISIEQTDGFVYVYTQESGTIPYVIVGYYNITAEDFTNQFTQYMAQEYSDLQVTSQESMITLNDREFSGIVYSYNVGGYVVQDTRLFFAENGNTYMFGAKEIPELSYYVGSTLEETAGSFAYLAGGDSDYTKHVDGTRSVTSDAAASDPIEDIESTVSDVLGQGGAGNDQSFGGTVSASPEPGFLLRMGLSCICQMTGMCMSYLMSRPNRECSSQQVTPPESRTRLEFLWYGPTVTVRSPLRSLQQTLLRAVIRWMILSPSMEFHVFPTGLKKVTTVRLCFSIQPTSSICSA